MSGDRYAVAVHVGAGLHAPSREEQEAGESAVRDACHVLAQGGDGVDAACAALQSLEKGGWCNAGIGSALNLDGGQEMDAGMMDGREGTWAAVAGVDVSTPSSLARSVLRQGGGRVGRDRLRIMPGLLVGNSSLARFAQQTGSDIPELEAGAHSIPQHVRNEYQAYLDLLDTESNENKGEREGEGGERKRARGLMDTVGVVVYDGRSETFVVGASSGGIPLKYPGRVGPAAVLGAGFYASDKAGVVVSGQGERIIELGLARAVWALLIDDEDDEDDDEDDEDDEDDGMMVWDKVGAYFEDQVVTSSSQSVRSMMGAIGMRRIPGTTSKVEVLMAHSSGGFGVFSQSSASPRVQSHITRVGTSGKHAGNYVDVSGLVLNL